MVCRKIKHIGNTARDLAIQLLTPIILFIVYREILGGEVSVCLVLALMVYGSPFSVYNMVRLSLLFAV